MSKKYKNDIVTPSMVVLDTGSSASAFYNQDLLKRIGETPKILRLVTNGGEMRDKKMGMHHDLRAWFNIESIANILSFLEVAKNHRVRMDAAKDEDILVEIKKDKWMRFTHNDLGLHVHDAKIGLNDFNVNDSNEKLSTYSFLQTVAENSDQHTAEERRLAHQAKSLSKRFRGIPLRKFSKWLNNNYIRNTPTTSKDSRRAENMHSKEVVRLRSLSVRSKSRYVNPTQTEVPRELLIVNQSIRLFIDIMHVNSVPFLHTISAGVKFRSSS